MKTGESRYGHGDLLSVPALRKDGTRISVEFTIVPLRDAAGQMDGMAAILRDVSQRFERLKLVPEVAQPLQPLIYIEEAQLPAHLLPSVHHGSRSRKRLKNQGS